MKHFLLLAHLLALIVNVILVVLNVVLIDVALADHVFDKELFLNLSSVTHEDYFFVACLPRYIELHVEG